MSKSPVPSHCGNLWNSYLFVEQSDETIAKVIREKFPEARKLMNVPGVGPITALNFVLTLGSPERFSNGRDVGAFLGMTPEYKQSGERDPQPGISKAGNRTLRRLLVQCAHHLLGHFGTESALRQWRRKLAARGGPNANGRPRNRLTEPLSRRDCGVAYGASYSV